MTKILFYKFSFGLSHTVFFPIYTQDFALNSELFKELFTVKIPKTAIHQYESETDMYFPKKEWDEVSKYLIESLKNETYFEDMKRSIVKSYEELNEAIKHLKSSENINVKEIFAKYKDYIDVLTGFRVYALIPNIMSLGDLSLMEHYKNSLSKILPNKEFSIMTTPNEISESTLAERDLLTLEENDLEIQKWIDKWGYIYYYYTGPLPDITEVRKMIKNTCESTPNVKQRLEEIKNYSKKIQQEKEIIVEDFNLSEEDIHLLDVISFFGYYKLERKELMQKSYVAFDILLNKLSKLTNLSVHDLKYLTLKETEQLFYDKKDFSEVILERKKSFMYVVTGENIDIYTRENNIKKIVDSWNIHIPSQKLTIAYSGGIVRGRMIIIDSKKDMEKIHNLDEGFILASGSTYPELVPAMKKSLGIITKIGGLTSHAGIVSRELKKPCIVGYKNLFEKFKEGDIIELNTDKGTVRKVEE